MTLPFASTLTDEQLRVLAAEAQGFVRARIGLQSRSDPIPRGWTRKGREYNDIPNYLHDANAAKGLLEKYGCWEIRRDADLLNDIAVTIHKEREGVVDDFLGEAPDFCRAAVLAFLRAEGKIL